jgi:hypothetical protein
LISHQILNYLKQLQAGTVKWGRMKISLVGKEVLEFDSLLTDIICSFKGSGKSSLILHIQNTVIKSNTITNIRSQGIEITSFITNDVQFNAWDFAGMYMLLECGVL